MGLGFADWVGLELGLSWDGFLGKVSDFYIRLFFFFSCYLLSIRLVFRALLGRSCCDLACMHTTGATFEYNMSLFLCLKRVLYSPWSVSRIKTSAPSCCCNLHQPPPPFLPGACP